MPSVELSNLKAPGRDNSPRIWDGSLDHQVAGVPEPASWAVMFVGLALTTVVRVFDVLRQKIASVTAQSAIGIRDAVPVGE